MDSEFEGMARKILDLVSYVKSDGTRIGYRHCVQPDAEAVWKAVQIIEDELCSVEIVSTHIDTINSFIVEQAAKAGEA